MPSPSLRLHPSAVIGPALLVALSCDGSSPPPRAPQADVVTIASVPAPSAAAPSAEQAAPGPRGARQVKLDGIGLGDLYRSTVMARPPYDAPCDDDPIDHKARRFMVYGAKPCRGRAFPEKTTLMFYLHFADGPQQLDQPIEAIAWLGGTWFSSRSNFPLRVGEPLARAAEAFGPVEKTLQFARKGDGLLVQRHPGPVYAIAEQDRLVGFVLGPMPDDPENEQWRGLMQMWTRYTKPSAAGDDGP